MKERVTLTIEKEVLDQVDSSIDGSLVKNRSHAFEILVTKALGSNKLTKALILAGGKNHGKISECMMKISGKPILQHNIELLRKYGVKDIVIALSTGNTKIKEVFGDGEVFGVNIAYVEEKDPVGTAGAMKQSKSFLSETFVMLNADEIKEINLNDMYTFHKENDGFATIALTTVRDPSKYGVAVLNGNKITTFIEKPNKDNSPSSLINAGLYIVEPEVIDLVPDGFAKMENDVFPKLANQERLYGYPFGGMWADINVMPKFKFSIKDINILNK